jgi:hypothetical protein
MDAERERLAVLVRTLDGPTLRHLAACADARKYPAVIDPEAAAQETGRDDLHPRPADRRMVATTYQNQSPD